MSNKPSSHGSATSRGTLKTRLDAEFGFDLQRFVSVRDGPNVRPIHTTPPGSTMSTVSGGTYVL